MPLCLRTVQGYEVTKPLSEIVIVSNKEGKRIREKDLRLDKKFGPEYVAGKDERKWRVNPSTYTEIERQFMEESSDASH